MKPNLEMMCYEPTAHLVQDHEGRPIVYVTLYYDSEGSWDVVSDVIKIYLEPLEAKHLGLALIRVGQDGIEAEIERERRELAKMWSPEQNGQSSNNP